MSEIFGKIFGKDKHQSQQSKDKEKCSSPSADKSAVAVSQATSAKTSDFCTYTIHAKSRHHVINFAPLRLRSYRNQYVCLSVCLSVCSVA